LLYTSFEAVTEISSISINFAIMTTSAAHCAYYEINKYRNCFDMPDESSRITVQALTK